MPYTYQSTSILNSINLKKADLTPAEKMAAYSETGSYMAQKYFGSPVRKMKTDEAQQIFGLDAEGKPSYGVPLSNYMNAQVKKNTQSHRSLKGKNETSLDMRQKKMKRLNRWIRKLS